MLRYGTTNAQKYTLLLYCAESLMCNKVFMDARKA